MSRFKTSASDSAGKSAWPCAGQQSSVVLRGSFPPKLCDRERLNVVLIRVLAGLLGSGLLIVPRLPAEAPGAHVRMRMSVYLGPAVAGPEPVFQASLRGRVLPVTSVTRITAQRPLLVVIDPTSLPRAELKGRLDELAGVLTRSVAPLQPLSIRIGVTVLDGVLSDPVSRHDRVADVLERAVTRFTPDSTEAQPIQVGRVVELLGALIEKAEADGPIDCLLLARDRELDAGSPEYLASALERRILETSLRKGSSVYGFLAGSALLGRLIAASGGEAFNPSRTTVAAVLGRIADARARGYLLELDLPYGDRDVPVDGRLEFSVAASPGAGRVRAPGALWLCPHARPTPSYVEVSNALDLLRRARQAEEESDYTRAAALIDNAMALDDANGAAAVAAARVALARNDLPRLAEFAARAVRTMPLTEDSVRTLADLMEQAGSTGAARDMLERLAAQDGALPEPVAARLHAVAGDFREAAHIYRRLLESGSANPAEVCGDYGWALLKSGDAAGARRQLESCAAVGPGALLAKSALEAEAGHISEALSLADRAARLRPNDADARIQVGKLRIAGRDWAAAVRDLEAAAALDPSQPDLLPLRVEALLGAGRLGDAERLLSRPLAGGLAPGVYSRVAELQVRIGNLAEGAKTLESGAAAAASGRHELFRRAAEIRERRGELGQALLDYRSAFDAAPAEVSAQMAAELSPHVEFLSTVLAGAAPAAQTGASLAPVPPAATARDSGLFVPGGTELLARVVGMDPGALKTRDSIERLFARILDAGSSNRDNELSRAVAASLKHYDALVRHLVKLNLVHREQDLQAPQELAFPISGPDVALAKTSEFLSFFSVKFKPGQGGNGPELTIQQGGGAEERQRLLRDLGVDLLSRELREIRFTLRGDRVPLLLGSDVWAATILGGVPAPALLGRMVGSMEAMKLYLGISRCSASTRDALLDAGLGPDLLHLANAIAIYGRYLKFKDGRLVLPGSEAAWELVIGTLYSKPQAFLASLVRKDQGRALLLYQGLSEAPLPVRSYLTQTPQRLLELYQLLAPYDSTRLLTWYGDSARQDLGRLLRLVSADDAGLFAPIDPLVVSRISPLHAGGAMDGAGKRRLDLLAVVGLMARGPSSASAPFYTPTDTLELLSFLRRTRPESVGAASLPSLLQDPAQVPVFLDLIWHVDPAPEVLAKYLTYCRELVQARSRNWNVNRTRSSQAFFYILSALCRERVLDHDRANAVLSDALSRFEAPSESAFAANLASLLSDTLLPAVRRVVGAWTGGGEDDPLMRAMAGTRADETFRFDGKDFRLAGSAFRLQRMRAGIQQQSVVGLAPLLEAYRLAASLGATGSPDEHAVDALTKLLEEIGSAQQLKDVAKDGLRSVAHAKLEELLQKVELARAGGAAEAVGAMSAGLHVELGISLLGYCYADNSTPDIDLLTFDPHFIRKHKFYPDVPGSKASWRSAYLDQSDTDGSVMTGALSGLDLELSRLETPQSGQSLGPDAAGLVPTLLSGLRAVPYPMRSSRAQEFVALSTRLGTELAVSAGRDPGVGSWVTRRTGLLISPRRHELLAEWTRRPDLSPDAGVLSRSELFLLGRWYLADAAGECPDSVLTCSGPVADPVPVPRFKSPTLDRLRSILPAPGTADAAQFEREVDLYGPHARSRIGLNVLSFSVLDSYENLERRLQTQLIFERLCDLRIRMAELNYALGLPSALGAFEGELAIRDIVPDSEQTRSTSWKLALDQIARLGPYSVRNWVEELATRGCLIESAAPLAESPAKADQ